MTSQAGPPAPLKVRASEVWAKATLECLSEVAATAWHDVGAGGYDLDVTLRMGSQCAVEVTEATSEEFRIAHARYQKAVPHSKLAVPGVSCLWVLTPYPKASFKHWDLALLSNVLQKLEMTQETFFTAELEYDDPIQGQVNVLRDEFGIESVWCQPHNGTGEVWVSPAAPSVWWSGGEAGQFVLATLERQALKPDNLSKLRASGKLDSRLFVWVDGLEFPSHEDLFLLKEPTRTPTLDPIICGAWLAATRNSIVRGLAFDLRRGWSTFEIDEDQFKAAIAQVKQEIGASSSRGGGSGPG